MNEALADFQCEVEPNMSNKYYCYRTPDILMTNGMTATKLYYMNHLD